MMGKRSFSQRSENVGRRQFLQHATAAGLLAAAGLPVLAQDTPQYTPAAGYAEAKRLANTCLNQYKTRGAEAEFYYRQCLRLGAPNRDEEIWLWHRLSLALARQSKGDEAWKIAQQCWETKRSAEHLGGLIEAKIGQGDFDEARQWMRFAERYPQDWGNSGDYLRWIRDQLTTRVYRCVMNFPADRPPRWGDKNVFAIAIPTSDSPVQKLLSMEFEGARSVVEKTDEMGNVYVEVEREPGQDIRQIAEVAMRPYSFKKDLSKFDPGPLPDEVKPYLGDWQGDRYIGPGYRTPPNLLQVGPNTPLVQGIVKPLLGRTGLESAENVLRWCAANLVKQVDPLVDPCTSDAVIEHGNGHCAQVTAAMAALLRGAGIPARALRGKPGCHGTSGMFLQHSVVELYLKGVGWVDLQNGEAGWRPRTNFLRFFRYMWPGPLSAYLPYTDQVEAPRGTYLGQIHSYEFLREVLD